MNLQYYDDYGIRVAAEQIKEKFGQLRFYYHVVTDDNSIRAKISNLLFKTCRLIEDRVDFKHKMVTDSPTYVQYQVKQLTDSEYSDSIKRWANCTNVAFETIGTSKNAQICEVVKFKSTHSVMTKHKILHKIKDFIWSLHVKLHAAYDSRQDSMLTVIARKINADVEDLVKNAEEECYNTCEKCGAQIGTEWSPRCQTTGWISYICTKCAKESSRKYYKNGALWSGDKCIMTKEQVEEQQRNFEEDHSYTDSDSDESENDLETQQ